MSNTRNGPNDPSDSRNSQMIPPAAWVDQNGHIYVAAPVPPGTPIFGVPISTPVMVAIPPPHPVCLPQSQSSFVDVPVIPVIVAGHHPVPESPPQELNVARCPPPTNLDMRTVSGTVDQILQWPEIVQSVPVCVVTGFLISIGTANGNDLPAPGNELNLLIREHRNSGGILRVIQPYDLRSDLPVGIRPGYLLRCTGKILDARMLAVKISVATPMEAISRLRQNNGSYRYTF